MERVDCLVLDDLGTTHREIGYLLEVLNKRVGKLTIFTSNFSIQMLEEMYYTFKEQGKIDNSNWELSKILEFIRSSESEELFRQYTN
ncbi:hypothetical protein CJ195_20935 [Bacillus sp. UMB0899]|uniref:hypothetical protein n=1 Tax=Metabacillus schmidteae TaxID=2730405 RepID=UPI000C800BBB|nr:hypothetical protein [Metabacillus schmidteae]PMC34975.1 hypothetical protein CJ195_20935 [Bacillus sp. UMB0899]